MYTVVRIIALATLLGACTYNVTVPEPLPDPAVAPVVSDTPDVTVIPARPRPRRPRVIFQDDRPTIVVQPPQR